MLLPCLFFYQVLVKVCTRGAFAVVPTMPLYYSTPTYSETATTTTEPLMLVAAQGSEDQIKILLIPDVIYAGDERINVSVSFSSSLPSTDINIRSYFKMPDESIVANDGQIYTANQNILVQNTQAMIDTGILNLSYEVPKDLISRISKLEYRVFLADVHRVTWSSRRAHDARDVLFGITPTHITTTLTSSSLQYNSHPVSSTITELTHWNEGSSSKMAIPATNSTQTATRRHQVTPAIETTIDHNTPPKASLRVVCGPLHFGKTCVSSSMIGNVTLLQSQLKGGFRSDQCTGFCSAFALAKCCHFDLDNSICAAFADMNTIASMKSIAASECLNFSTSFPTEAFEGDSAELSPVPTQTRSQLVLVVSLGSLAALLLATLLVLQIRRRSPQSIFYKGREGTNVEHAKDQGTGNDNVQHHPFDTDTDMVWEMTPVRILQVPPRRSVSSYGAEQELNLANVVMGTAKNTSHVNLLTSQFEKEEQTLSLESPIPCLRHASEHVDMISQHKISSTDIPFSENGEDCARTQEQHLNTRFEDSPTQTTALHRSYCESTDDISKPIYEKHVQKTFDNHTYAALSMVVPMSRSPEPIILKPVPFKRNSNDTLPRLPQTSTHLHPRVTTAIKSNVGQVLTAPFAPSRRANTTTPRRTHHTAVVDHPAVAHIVEETCVGDDSDDGEFYEDERTHVRDRCVEYRVRNELDSLRQESSNGIHTTYDLLTCEHANVTVENENVSDEMSCAVAIVKQ